MGIKRYIFILLCLNCLCIFAQQEGVRVQVNAIKKNSDYIYGEASGDKEEECLEIAREKLLMKVRNFVNNHQELSDADAFIVDSVKSKTKKLIYERSFQICVVCVYVHKKDILPLYKSKNQVIEDTAYEIKELEKEERKDSVILEPEIGVVKQLEEKKEDKGNEKAMERPYSVRESEILSVILGMKNYDEIYRYLENEKNTRFDIRFKLVKSADVKDCFWLVFNSSKELVAVYDKLCSKNLLDENGMDWNSCKDYPKIWMYIYE